MAEIEPLKVLFLTIPRLFNPWCADVIAAVGDRHDLRVFDTNRSITSQFHGIDVVIDHGGHVGTHQMMDAAAGSRLWQLMTIGYAHVDIAYLQSRHLPVAAISGTTSAASLAESAMMLILMLARRTGECDRCFRSGGWLEPPGDELEGRTLGIVGLGPSGRRLARFAGAMNMRVIGANRSSVDDPELGLSATYPLEQLDSLLQESDFISLHLALTKQTHQIIDARRIGLIKSTARLINTARGALVDQKAMFEALLAGRIGGAGLDVLEPEPPDPTHPVFDLPQVVIMPHVAAFTDGSSCKRGRFISDNLDRVAQGLPPRCQIA